MTVDFAKEYLLDDCADCAENKDGECMTQSHCFEVKRMTIQALEHLEQTRWIPVSERLPEIGQYVLCSLIKAKDVKHRVIICEYKQEVWWSYVQAWMPLPQPYKGESEDKE